MLSRRSQQAIDRLIERRPHSVMIVGEQGMGQSSAVTGIAESLLDAPSDPRQLLRVQSIEDKSIGIEQIPQIQTFLQYRHNKPSGIAQIAVVDCTQGITAEAQNALLKLFEEPPAGSMIVLLVPHTDQVLQTIVSRAQVVQLAPLTLTEAQEKWKDIPPAQLKKAFMLSEGKPELFEALLSNTEHEIHEQIESAKVFLKSSPYERMLHASNYAESGKLGDLLQALVITVSAALHTATTDVSIRGWSKTLSICLKAQDHTRASANTKLLYTWLCLNV